MARLAPSKSTTPVFITREREWRRHTSLDDDGLRSRRIITSRWIDDRNLTREVAITHGTDHYTLCLALRSTSLVLKIDGHEIHDGRVTPGTVQVSAPGACVQALIREPCDFLHVRVANWFLTACCHDFRALPLNVEPCSEHCGFSRDTVIEMLTQAILAAQAPTGDLHSRYVDGIASAIVTRLVTSRSDWPPSPRSHGVRALAKWRLTRTIDYIDAHLAEPILLGDMATTAGLSRMHFAAQFRAATGFRPREYLLRRRIDRAKSLLASTDLTLVEVALGVGFSNQAHFSTVFRRFVGQAPRTWQKASRLTSPCEIEKARSLMKDRHCARHENGLAEEGANP